jgi:hypothetical protein
MSKKAAPTVTARDYATQAQKELFDLEGRLEQVEWT